MKVRKQLHYFYLIFGFLLVLVSCAKENEKVEIEEPPPKADDFILCEDEGFKNDSTLDCGCDSEILTVINTENKEDIHLSVGFLSKTDSSIFSQASSYSYMITVDDKDEAQTYFYFICNAMCISSSFENISINSKIEVKFSGNVKRECDGVSGIANIIPVSIILTKIAKK